MKRSLIAATAMAVLVAIVVAMPAFAGDFDDFLGHHPNVNRELSQNPNLIYNPGWRAQHPQLQQWLGGHPGAWQEMRENYGHWGRRGDWDDHRVWRDPDWWHDHHPDWFWQHHPEWAESHPEWRKHDGDWDDHHNWHDFGWWEKNHPEWAEHHHPEWGERWKHHEKEEHEHGRD
jgi:hypothetical protein